MPAVPVVLSLGPDIPDGLYFAPLLPDPQGRTPLLRVSYVETGDYPFAVWSGSNALVVMRESGCLGCHTVNGVAEGYGPPLDSRGALASRLETRLHSAEYLATLDELDRLGQFLGLPFKLGLLFLHIGANDRQRRTVARWLSSFWILTPPARAKRGARGSQAFERPGSLRLAPFLRCSVFEPP